MKDYIVDKPTYFELDGKAASMVPNAHGGITVSVPSGMSITTFMSEGSIISKDKYDELSN